MAKVTSFLKLRTVGGGFVYQAQGTMSGASDGGSFAVQLDSAGSAVLRNIQNVLITNLGTEAVQVGAQGTTGYYVTLSANRLGTFVTATPGGTVDIHFQVTGGGGSI